MPPLRIPPIISMSYRHLRSYVCKFRASALHLNAYPPLEPGHPVPVSRLFACSVCDPDPTPDHPVCVVANLYPVLDLFYYAVRTDRGLYGSGVVGRRVSSGSTRLDFGRLNNRPELGSLVCLVCWQSGDGFVLGDGNSPDDLLFEPGFGLVVVGGEAVGVVGFLEGRPFGMFLPAAVDPLIQARWFMDSLGGGPV